MSNASSPPASRVPWERAAGALRLPFRLLAAGAEFLVCPRGLGLFFLALAVLFTVSCWLRPPLSPDLTAGHLPVFSAGGRTPEELLTGPRRFLPASVGAVLLGLIAAGAVVVVLRPRRLGLVAGLLLAFSIAANAAAALNHPALVEMMDLEYEQREQATAVIAQAPEQNYVTNPSNARPGPQAAPAEDQQRGDLVRGWAYLTYGLWLVAWAATGCLTAARGPGGRRLLVVTGWALGGCLLACLVCGPRLRAEYAWVQAREQEIRGDFPASRRSLEAAVACVPELESLERTWLLRGKLDYLQGRSTAQARFFRAYQLARDKQAKRGLTHREDLPWITRTTANPATPGASTPPPYDLATINDLRKALGLLEDMPGAGDRPPPAVRNQLARLWGDTALQFYLHPENYTEDGLDYTDQARGLGAAGRAWQEAAAAAPSPRLGAFGLGTAAVRDGRGDPDRAALAYAVALNRLADRPLAADILSSLSRAYYEAGRANQGRRLDAGSADRFSLPESINQRALKGLGGL